jgi:hypothetical protein
MAHALRVHRAARQSEKDNGAGEFQKRANLHRRESPQIAFTREYRQFLPFLARLKNTPELPAKQARKGRRF